MVPAAPNRPRGRPAQISRDRIVEAAAAADNLDTLTMRELADHLGVSHGSLYRWVTSRDELIDLLSEVLVERILDFTLPARTAWRRRLTHLAWRMHDEFLAVRGFSTHLARPHRHNATATARLREAIISTLLEASVSPGLAEQSYYIFMTSVVSWLAFQENPSHLGVGAPRFDLFLDTLLRGLPPREPGIERP
jgi:AcrR family transcriptional regulator